ncbi:hypothetical protein JOS77_21665 [Chromobacterium haemolyticum]|nr:hypothetical protein JOS77_21665 [Chromobacterium haemolyticum]
MVSRVTSSRGRKDSVCSLIWVGGGLNQADDDADDQAGQDQQHHQGDDDAQAVVDDVDGDVGGQHGKSILKSALNKPVSR